MNDRKKMTILYIIVSFILIVLLITAAIIINNSTSTTPTINVENNKITKIVKSDTLSEIVYKASNEIYKGPGITPDKIAYITIDDGPSKYTNEILDTLNKNNVNATFFMINGNMQAHPEEVKRIIKDGNTAGFHSVSHDIHKLYQSPEATVEEFDTCNDTLYKISGETSKIIRLPYGSKPYAPEESYNKLIDNGYLIWDWNLDTEDWRSTKDQIISNILYYGRDKKEIVILMHEKEQSAKALNNIILILKERGYKILPVTNHDNPKNFWERNLK